MFRPFLCAVLALTLSAGCGRKESSPSSASPSSPSPSSTQPLAPAWKHIDGGKEHRFAGAVADVPGAWTLVPQGNATLLVPPGANQTSIEEIYALMGDQLTAAADGGESRTFTLEARTEAGTGAAVIAIDGTEFRQAEGRPW